MIPKNIKLQVVKELLKDGSFYKKDSGTGDLFNFINLIWPLREMPSEDSRYETAYKDAMQHLVNNDDWDDEFTLIERFKLVESDESHFLKFIEVVMSPDLRETKGNIQKFYYLITQTLKYSDYRLAISEYFEGLPVYKLVEKHKVGDLPREMVANGITFYKGDPQSADPPYFYLTGDNWDDFHSKTSMRLYYRDKEIVTRIGHFKLMRLNTNNTWEELPDNFKILGSEYCSLGQDNEYYETLKQVFPNSYNSILLALRDAAFFPKIAEDFENEPAFKNSLLRMNDAEKNLRTIRFEFAGTKLEDRFKFTYRFQPPYSESILNFDFDFDFTQEIEHRIYAIIGKNGSGKTQLLSSLARQLSTAAAANILPQKPIFGKIISVSYSFFDSFDIPEGDAQFNYCYCGLKKQDGTWLSSNELLTRYYEAIEKIEFKKLVREWYRILRTFLPDDITNLLFNVDSGQTVEYRKESFIDVEKKLSSGQTIQIFIITEILANIREESLILYDEPETHLHPNAISTLAKTLFKLVERFDSFCIMATHSPLLIQELYARNVFIVERENEIALLRRLEKECFAENLTVITDDIFGNRDIDHHYIKIIQDLVDKKKNFDEVVSSLEDKAVPLNLNTRLYIKSLLKSI